jgi:mRNA interferase RelE/StbE
MKIEWQPRAVKDLSRLDKRMQQRILSAVERLAESGYGDVTKLTDVNPPEYRLRVGDWRVRFALTEAPESMLMVLRVLPRNEAYR